MATTRSKELRAQPQRFPVKAKVEKKPADLKACMLPFNPNSKHELDGPKNPVGGERRVLQ